MKRLFGRKTKNKTKNACREETVSCYAANALKSCNEITRLHSSVHNFTKKTQMFSVQLVIQVLNTVSK